VAVCVLLGVLFGCFIVFGPKLDAVLYVTIRSHDICAVVSHRPLGEKQTDYDDKLITSAVAIPGTVATLSSASLFRLVARGAKATRERYYQEAALRPLA
jgi:hypothetical protein